MNELLSGEINELTYYPKLMSSRILLALEMAGLMTILPHFIT
jgi:hypothetical protein